MILNGCRAKSYLDPHLVSDIKVMLDEHNVFARSFRMVKERFKFYKHKEHETTTYI